MYVHAGACACGWVDVCVCVCYYVYIEIFISMFFVDIHCSSEICKLIELTTEMSFSIRPSICIVFHDGVLNMPWILLSLFHHVRIL